MYTALYAVKTYIYLATGRLPKSGRTLRPKIIVVYLLKKQVPAPLQGFHFPGL
jgi:hypothetical protein